MRYRITLSYDGAAFCGWQVQPNGPAIQEQLEKALSTLMREEVGVTGAGRTDSDVNAVNYVAHFDLPEETDGAALARKLNAMMPKGISIHAIVPADPGFHARFDARMREYKYFIHRRKDPFANQYSYLCTYRLDVDRMNRAAQALVGRHDFSCFEKTGGDNKTSLCTVSLARWEEYSPDHVRLLGYPAGPGDYLMFTIRADRFLRNMVRAIVGSLLDVGRGRHEEKWIAELVAGTTDSDGASHRLTRSDAGESVPGNALFLTKVEYDK